MPSKKPALTCEMCQGTNIIRHLPQEINRRLDHEEITVPDDESGRKKLTVAILRITYEREFICANCGHQWIEELVTEKQQHV